MDPPSAAGSAAPMELQYMPLNAPERLNRAAFSLYLPPTVNGGAAVRGIVALSANTALYEDAAWRALAERQRVALLRYDVQAMPATATAPAGPAATGDGLRSITRAMQEFFSLQSRHMELRDAPFFFVGAGESALQVCTFADMIPDYVAGIVAMDVRETPALRRLAGGQGTRVPQLIATADGEAAFGALYLQAARRIGGPITLVNDRGGATRDFALQWTEAVIRLRLPPRVIAGRGVSMNPAAEDLFAGDPATGTTAPLSHFKGDKLKAVWLPDEGTARAWREAMRAAK